MRCIHQSLVAVFVTIQSFAVIQLFTVVQLDMIREQSGLSYLSHLHSEGTTSYKRKIIYFLHIHKSGGHSICRQAQENNMIANFENVCNVQKDQHCCGGEDSLAAQIEFAESTNYTFVASEKEMYDAMTTEYYIYVVVLRDSKSRYKSHWKHLVLNANTYSAADIKGDMDPVHDRYMIPMHGVRYSVGNMTKWWQNQPDNYNVRMICGSKCAEIPKYQITPELFKYTLMRLDKFSHVMFLEDMEHSFGEFTRQMGWNTPVNASVLHQNAKVENPTKFSRLPVENVWDPFMTVLDDALYDHARQKYQERRIDNVVVGPATDHDLVRDYFQHGPSRNCANACCGECSIW
jgi:hypothetical protein